MGAGFGLGFGFTTTGGGAGGTSTTTVFELQLERESAVTSAADKRMTLCFIADGFLGSELIVCKQDAGLVVTRSPEVGRRTGIRQFVGLAGERCRRWRGHVNGPGHRLRRRLVIDNRPRSATGQHRQGTGHDEKMLRFHFWDEFEVWFRVDGAARIWREADRHRL